MISGRTVKKCWIIPDTFRICIPKSLVNVNVRMGIKNKLYIKRILRFDFIHATYE